MLTLLGDEAREQRLANWKPDEALAQVLPDAKLTGQVTNDKDGKRLRLSLQWKKSVDSQPLSLTGWIQSE